VWDSLVQVVPDAILNVLGERDDIVVLTGICRENPAMMAQQLAMFDRVEQLLAEAIAERAGADVERDLAPRLLAAVAAVAVRTSVAVWAKGDSDASLPDLIRESVAQLRAGLPLGRESTTPAA
jgi:hypothetical protein